MLLYCICCFICWGLVHFASCLRVFHYFKSHFSFLSDISAISKLWNVQNRIPKVPDCPLEGYISVESPALSDILHHCVTSKTSNLRDSHFAAFFHYDAELLAKLMKYVNTGSGGSLALTPVVWEDVPLSVWMCRDCSDEWWRLQFSEEQQLMWSSLSGVVPNFESDISPNSCWPLIYDNGRLELHYSAYAMVTDKRNWY